MSIKKEYSLVNDLGFVKTGVNKFHNKRKYYSTGSIKEKIFTHEGEYNYDNCPTRANREVKEGDVLQARMMNTNKAILIDKKLEGSLFSTGFFQFRPPKELVVPKFLYYFLSSKFFLDKKDNLCGGSTQKAINDTNLKKIKISLPSLSQQQLIVAKLDASFADIDKLINLEFLNIKNTESILTNSLSKIFLHKSKDSKEKEYELGKICKIVGGGTPSKSNPKFYEGEIPWATVRDMKNDIIEKTQFKINKEATIKSSTNIIPKENIVISTRVGLGKVCILKNDTAINQDLKGIIPFNPKIVEVNFLFYWFKAISKIIVEFGTGLTVQGVKLPFIKSLKINLPSINEQRIIINQIQSLQFHLNNIKIIKEKKINNLKFLKNSLLKDLLNKNKAA